MSTHTVNKYLGRMGSIFTYAVNHGKMTENFAANKRLKKDKKKAKDGKRVFTPDELVKLFHVSNKLYRTKAAMSKEPYMFWIHLIGIFTGMRIGEICQLRTSDVYLDTDDTTNYWIFDVNEDGYNKTCKTEGSERVIPVHSELIKMGFLDYVEKRKSSEQGQLWDVWEFHHKNGWSHKSSRRTKTFITSVLGDDEQSFHCFRHNVVDLLMKNRCVSKSLQGAILGHSHKGESYGRYGKGLSLDELKDGIEMIQYSYLDLSHLYK